MVGTSCKKPETMDFRTKNIGEFTLLVEYCGHGQCNDLRRGTDRVVTGTRKCRAPLPGFPVRPWRGNNDLPHRPTMAEASPSRGGRPL